MERNQSLTHILVSGLVGLMLGLFIGWWVWPVEWTDPPGAAGQPAAASPSQDSAPAAEQIPEEDPGDTSFQDWLNQALLYLAAALLVGGAVAIGYQFLRQPEHGASSRRSAGSTNARQAAVQHARRPRPVFVSGKRTGPRAPGLDWIRRSRPSHDEADVDEPVFPSQSGPQYNAGEESRFARPAEAESSQGGDAEAGSRQLSAGEEETPLSESRAESQTEWADSPAPSSPGGRDREGISRTGMPEAAQPEPLYDRSPLPGESREPQQFEAESSSQPAEQITAEDALATRQEIGAIGDDQSVDTVPREERRQTAPDPQTSAGVQAVDSVDAKGRGLALSEDEPAPLQEGLAQPQVDLSAAGASTDIERRDGDRSPASDVLATFEANYAFGIQSYDQSFTITAPDGELLGACGMGMNESLDREAADTGQVRLLEIWLYDRSAVRSISQLLVSPGFDATLLDDHTDTDSTNRSPPLELKPGMTCGLRSRHIQLDCTIKDVSWLDGGQSPRPLRSVSAALVVSSPA